MASSEIQQAILKQLRSIRETMLGLDFVFQVDEEPEDVRSEAGSLLLSVQRMILKLENDELATIRDQLEQLEPDLTNMIDQLQSEFKKLESIKDNLALANKFLGVVGKVLSIAV